MVIDTSALLAILLAEPGSDELVTAIRSVDHRAVGVPTLVEATAVMLARKGKPGVIALDALLARLDIEVVAMTVAAGEFARAGYARYGKGVGSPGVLNYGETLAYGVARATDEPLLYTGDDFPRTDVRPAV